MNRITSYGIGLFFVSLCSCVEEIDLKTEIEQGFERALVIEATITNETKRQIVLLSRAYLFEEQAPSPESFAQVNVIGSDGSSYQFQETDSGKYESVDQFAAQPNTEYQLEIITSDGRSYLSTEEVLTNITQIDDLYFERDFNENGQEGVAVYVDSFDPTGNSKYYRYTYEETFKVIAPKYSPEDLIVISRNPYSFELQPKPEQQQICYASANSKDIIIENTNKFEEDRVEKFRVVFLSRDNAVISHRYSILVRQFIQSSEANEYYRILRDLSSSDDVLSQSQPGFLNGNVFSSLDQEEKVIGFFQVSSVNERRIYFNYSDLFPNENLPPYFQSCPAFAPVEMTIAGTSPLADALDQGFKYFEPNNDILPDEGAYDLVAPICGNCTILGNNFPPDFWEE